MKTNVSPTGKKSSRVFGILMGSFIFSVLLLTSCTKEDITPNADAVGSAQANSAVIAGVNQNNSNATHQPNSSQTLPIVPAGAVIYISHGSCLGQCAAYTVAVKADGTVIYDGIHNTGTAGIVRFSVSKDMVDRLHKMMINAGFMDFPTCYPMLVDVPETITAMRLDWENSANAKFKIVQDWGVQVPENLAGLRNMIEAALGVDKLVSGYVSGQTMGK